MNSAKASEGAYSSVTIIVPVLNEAANCKSLLDAARQWDADQSIFVDGGSRDGTDLELESAERNDRRFVLLRSEKGRSTQMQAGAQIAEHEWLLFLHADTQLPTDYKQALNAADRLGFDWGRFDLSFTKTDTRLDYAMRVIAAFINGRSRLSGIATGDQALFVRRTVFEQQGGFAAMPLMEDIDLCVRLKRVSKPYTSDLKVLTSPRRWQTRGVVRTVVLMWVLRFGFWIGVPSANLARLYANVR